MSKVRLKTPVHVAPRKPPPVPVRRQQGTPVQAVLSPALRVGAVNDPAEREAETMAARVVGSLAPTSVPAPVPKKSTAKVAPVHRSEQPNTDELTPEPVSAEQSDFELPAKQDVAADGLTPADTQELDTGKPFETGGDDPISPARDGATVGRMGGIAPSDVSSLVGNPGPGRPLPSGLRARVEPHFGTSFEDVRLHTTTADQRAATRIGARAFTHKNHIWLGPGESETNTRLMAHELTHVVQQTEGKDTLPINRTEVPTIRREGWFAGKAEQAARHVPGYTLITVIIGKKLISGDRVQRTAENLLGGLFGLVPGGTAIFDKLKEAQVVQEAYTWVQDQLSDLNLTWSRVEGTIEALYDGLISLSPVRNATRILGALVRDILSFVGRITKKVLEFVVRGALKLAGPYADKVWGIIQQAGDVIGLILENPLQFALNLVKSVVGGFMQFGANILTHLKNGLLGWLFGALTSAGIELPAKLDFKGLMSLVMQILGLTYKNFRDRLVRQLGPSGEKKVSMLEKSVAIVKILITEGFAGIWKKMLEMIENFKETLIGGMTTMVISTIIRAGIGWLAGLSNPVGAVVKVVLAIYDLIVAFLERLDQILDVAQAIFSSVGAIARGQLTSAKNFVEETIGRTVPVVISFLAALLGLGGISGKIKGVIKKLQAPVLKAMDKLIKFVIKKAKKLFAKLIGKLNGKRKLPSANFKIGDKQHRILAGQKDKKRVEIRIASVEQPVEKVQRYNALELENFSKMKPNPDSTKVGKKISAATDKSEVQTRDDEKKIDLGSEKNNNLAHLQELQAELKNQAKLLNDAGLGIMEAGYITPDDTSEPPLFRVTEPRDAEFEGKGGLYQDLQKQAKEMITPLGSSKKSDVKRSAIYELDHIIEKQFPKTILNSLHQLDDRNADAKKSDVKRFGDADRDANRKDPKRNVGVVYRTKFKNAAGEEVQPTALGEIGNERATSRVDINAPAAPVGTKISALKFDTLKEDGADLPAVAVFHRNHLKKKVEVKDTPLKIIRAAMDAGSTTADRHKSLSGALAKQLNNEIVSVSKQMEADKSSNSTIRKNVATGLNTVRSINANLYNFAQEEVPAATSKTDEQLNELTPGGVDWRAQSGNAKFGPADSPMTGLGDGPSFLQEEGSGGAYNAAARSKEGYLESDHVIDKSYPLAIQNALLTTDAAAAVEAKAIEKRVEDGKSNKLTQKQIDRLQRVKGRVFPTGSTMAKYTKDNGYAIALQRTLAKRVTSNSTTQGKVVSDLIDEGRKNTFMQKVDYVLTGRPTLKDVRKSLASGAESQFIRHTEKHEGAIAAEYKNDLTAIPASHPTELQPIARQHMIHIVNRVGLSLGEANKLTRALF